MLESGSWGHSVLQTPALVFINISEICAVSKVSKKEIGRVFKLILKTLETNVELITTGDFMVCKTSHISKDKALISTENTGIFLMSPNIWYSLEAQW